MSGIEFIIATALAAIPLSLEAFDRSGRAFEAISVFRHHSREILTLDARLGTQKAIFRNTSSNLLFVITKDRSNVQEVVSRPSGAAKKALGLSPGYELRRLGVNALEESFVACHQTVHQIEMTLQELCLKVQEFHSEVDLARADVNAEWLTMMKARIKLSLNKPRIDRAISKLQKTNQDFELIANQIIRSLDQITEEQKNEGVTQRKSARYLNMLQRYHQVRSASTALYSTLELRWTCSTHHLIDLRIADNDTRGASSRVTCELCISHHDMGSKTPLRLQVEHALDEDNNEVDDADWGGNSHWKNLETGLQSSADKFKLASPLKTEAGLQCVKAVRIIDVAPQIPQFSPHLVAAIEPENDLGPVENFCETFHRGANNLNCLERPLLGVLRSPHTQWFYLSPPQVPLGTSRPLSNMIAWIAEEPIVRSLPRRQLVELAGNVAEGIMQFYSTPWLTSHVNLGHTVRLFYPDGLSAQQLEIQPKQPYFMARVEGPPKAKGKQKLVETDETMLDFSSARNKLLFGFGILLIEIGYSKPWHVLKQSISTSTTAGGQLSDYRVAEKLAQSLVNEMGLTYSKIAKKCLGCDFGLGETDLDNEDLQRKFLEDVVSGLGQLTRQMREMNMYPLG
ncbi:hypothetical protein B0T25DRAFT_468891 [Lasiosphaeria hispida]|uniref:DUF7580 domain-containing protein n=1 Tax=Lasiosphaeria hispida TaxID=260671 RepID=A0AAJ0MK30_9PEZI|nr:hypothetical protein B0T25DRAFT_468891 [Lasiosphaeria hispida]